ncbi:cyclase/dehydrase [Atractiella rhizophila]|nr:cyclase/dehydrase [Atractiella rhizophila]
MVFVRYTQKELYQVIADIDSYSAFVPFCTSSNVNSAVAGPSKTSISRLSKPWLKDPAEPNEPNDFQLRAELKVGFMTFQERYESTVECRRWDLVKATSNNASLFKHLSTTWALRPHPTLKNSTIVDFSLCYSFASPVYASVSSVFFDKVSSQMVNAFQSRCEKIYGRRRR